MNGGSRIGRSDGLFSLHRLKTNPSIIHLGAHSYYSIFNKENLPAKRTFFEKIYNMVKKYPDMSTEWPTKNRHFIHKPFSSGNSRQKKGGHSGAVPFFGHCCWEYVAKSKSAEIAGPLTGLYPSGDGESFAWKKAENRRNSSIYCQEKGDDRRRMIRMDGVRPRP